MYSGALIIFLVVGMSVGFALGTNDPHWVQRGGALLAAISALIIIGAVSLEVQEAQASHERVPERQRALGLGQSVQTLARRIAKTRMRTKLETLSAQRLRMVFVHSFLAVLGEILHGFGDLLFTALLSASGSEIGIH